MRKFNEDIKKEGGFSFIPASTDEIRKVIKNEKIQRSIITLFNKLRTIDLNIKDPIAINRINNKIKVINKLKSKHSLILKKLNIKAFNDLKPLSVTYGNGSRGFTGIHSGGFLFERDLYSDLISFMNGKSEFKHEDFIKEINKRVKPNEIKEIINTSVLNQKRPLVIKNGQLLIKSDRTYNIGKTIADIIIKKKNDEEIYLSLKYKKTESARISFFNIGVRKVLLEAEIKNFKIKNENGKALLNFFGIDEKRFCSIFNILDNRHIPIDKKYMKAEIVESPADKSSVQKLLKSGIGQGYLAVYKIGNRVEIEEMDKDRLDKLTRIKNIKIYYPELGKGRYLKMKIETTRDKFEINIRNPVGNIYPTGMFCFY